MHPSSARGRATIGSVVAASLVVSVLAAPAAAQPQTAVDPPPIATPVRRLADAPPAAPPAVPAGAETVEPLTLNVTTRQRLSGGEETSIRRVVSRTRQRVHLEAENSREWLFERNPVDPRRVEGWLVVHARRTIVMYDESALRNWLGIRGWADVVTLGLDPDQVRQLAPTGDTQVRAGMRFERYRRPRSTQPDTSGIGDLWWCAAHALPLGFTTTDRDLTTVVAVERISPGVDAERLRAPIERFPAYQVIDLADWLEDR